MTLCVAAGDVVLRLAVSAFTLAWSHTVEHQPWQEDWRVEERRLVLEEVRVKGSGAGMEPPPDARLVDGWYAWRPSDAERHEIVLRRADGGAGRSGDWFVCPAGGGCTALGDLVAPDADPVTLFPCS